MCTTRRKYVWEEGTVHYDGVRQRPPQRTAPLGRPPVLRVTVGIDDSSATDYDYEDLEERAR